MNKRKSLRILVNCSNLKIGGGIQVADSVCRELFNFSQHKFIVVYYKALADCASVIDRFQNVETIEYEIPINAKTVITGRCKFLDDIVENRNIDAVLTIFGPSCWRPKVPHLSGFAQGHIVLPDSPFWEMLPIKKKMILWAKLKSIEFSLNKCADYYYTENPMITERLQRKYPRKKVFTVTNNANQIFNQPEQWDRSIILPEFDGLTLLTVAANYPHKNLPIIKPTCQYLEKHYPELRFRFVLTIDGKDDARWQTEEVKRHVVFLGPVKIQQVPNLYAQSDVMFLPTLLECFSASYAEAMVMRKPILTTDLVFARGLCRDAALYYDATSPEALGKAIVQLAEDGSLKEKLVIAGDKQLLAFDTFEQRAEKLIKIVERIS